MVVRAKTCGRDCCNSTLHGPTLGLPFGAAAIQHCDLAVAKGTEHPPDTAGAGQLAAIVGDNHVIVTDTHGAHRIGEGLGFGKHMRQTAVGRADHIDVEALGAGNMACHVFRIRIAVFSRQIEGAIQNFDLL